MSLLVKNGCFFVDQKRLDLTLSLAPGETKGIYGASGTGKSTLFHLLARKGLKKEPIRLMTER